MKSNEVSTRPLTYGLFCSILGLGISFGIMTGNLIWAIIIKTTFGSVEPFAQFITPIVFLCTCVGGYCVYWIMYKK